MPTIILGAQGQLGKELRNLLPEALCLSRKDLDISNSKDVADLLQKERPNLVINAAAYTYVDKAESDTATAKLINEDSVRNLALLCEESKTPLIHFSTDYVYPGNRSDLIDEREEALPLNVYGKTKLAGDQAVLKTNTPHLVIRTSWVLSSSGENFITKILRAAEVRPEIKVVADQEGCPTPACLLALEVAESIPRFLQGQIPNGVYHVAGENSVSWFRLAEIILDERKMATGKFTRVLPCSSSEWPSPAKRPANARLSCKKWQEATGREPLLWEPKVREIVRGIVQKEEEV